MAGKRIEVITLDAMGREERKTIEVPRMQPGSVCANVEANNQKLHENMNELIHKLALTDQQLQRCRTSCHATPTAATGPYFYDSALAPTDSHARSEKGELQLRVWLLVYQPDRELLLYPFGEATGILTDDGPWANVQFALSNDNGAVGVAYGKLKLVDGVAVFGFSRFLDTKGNPLEDIAKHTPLCFSKG